MIQLLLIRLNWRSGGFLESIILNSESVVLMGILVFDSWLDIVFYYPKKVCEVSFFTDIMPN